LISSALKYFQRLKPIVNGAMNAFISTLWIVGFGFLAHAMRYSLTRPCTITMWANNTGVLVCQLYKINFSAAIVGM
jgi:hypothetical protein